MAGYDLKTALQKILQKRQNFALYRGEEGDQIFISPLPPTPKQLADIEKETGEGKRILKGVCFREGATLVFATRNPAAPAWEKMLIGVLKERKCAQFLPLALRQLGAGEPDTASGQDIPGAVAAPTGAGDDAKAEWERFKSSLMPQLRTAIADPASKEKVTQIVRVAQASEKAGDYPAAIAILKKLAAVLGLTLPPPANVRPPQAGKLQAAMNKLAPAFQRAVAARPERKEELLRPVVVFQRQLKEEKLQEARETLRGVGRLLQSALAG